MLHTIRQLVGDDEKWRAILRGANATFRHQVITGAQLQAYFSEQAGFDLSKVFQQYLTTVQVPELQWRIAGDSVSFRWADVVPGFDMPVEVGTGDGAWTRWHPTETWQVAALPGATPATFLVKPDYYVTAREVTE
jgi:aminopeptidase N